MRKMFRDFRDISLGVGSRFKLLATESADKRRQCGTRSLPLVDLDTLSRQGAREGWTEAALGNRDGPDLFCGSGKSRDTLWSTNMTRLHISLKDAALLGVQEMLWRIGKREY